MANSVTTETKYIEAAKVAAAFWDWRHRLMMFFFTILAALAALEGWILDKHLDGRYISGPLLLAGVLGGVCAVLDSRIKRILRGAYSTASEFEDEVGAYSVLKAGPQLMSIVLFWTYSAIGLLLFVAGMVDVLLPVSTRGH